MPLNWQTAQVVLDRGLDTKTDPKIVAKLLKAENCVWSNPGSIRKRNGMAQVTTPFTPQRLAKRGLDLIAIDGHNRWVQSPTAGTWFERGRISEAQMFPVSLVRDASQDVSGWDVAVCSTARNLIVAVYAVAVGGVSEIRAIVTDAAAEATIFHGRVSTTNSTTYPKIVAAGQYIFIFYTDAAGTTIYGRRWDSASPSTFGAEFTLTTDLQHTVATGYYEVAPFSATAWLVAWAKESAAQVRLSKYDTAAAPNVVASIAVAERAAGPIGLCGGILGAIIYINFPSATVVGMRAFGYSTALALQWSTTIKAGASTWTQVSCVELSAAAALIVWDTGTASDGNIIARGVSFQGVINGIEQTYAHLCMRTKPWLDSGLVFLGVTTGTGGTASQSPYVSAAIVDITDNFDAVLKTARPVGTTGQLISGSNNIQGILSTVTARGSSKYTMLFPVQFKPSQLSTTYIRIGLNRVDVDMGSAARWAPAELGTMAMTASGISTSFDGTYDVETGFLVPIEQPTYSPVAGGGLGVGPYQYCHCYMFVDFAGNVHRSAPSIAFNVPMGGSTKVNITNLRSCVLTQKQDHLKGKTDPPVIIETYRTLSNSTGPFYNLTSLLTTVINDPFGSTQSVSDTISDGVAQLQPTLYTGSGSLSNYPPPPCSIMEVFKNCLFVDSTEDGSIWQSKPFIVGEGAAFSPALRYVLPTTERPTAILAMDDKLVVWTNSHIFIGYGEPFDDKGGGNGLTFQQVSGDTGAVDWRGVVLGQDGAFFYSPKGLYLLTRGLQLVYVGADIEADTKIAGTQCTFAVMTADRQEVRFGFIGGGSSLTATLNYQARSQDAPFGKWSTFTFSENVLPDFTSAIVVNGAYYAAGTAGIFKETTGYTDAGGWYTMTAIIPVYPAGLQGFVRCRYAQIRGEYAGTHQVTILVGTDLEASQSPTQTVTFADATLVALAKEEVGISLVKQLGSGYQFTIADGSDAGWSSGNSLTLSGLILDFAVKKGPRRVPAAATG